MLFSDSSRCLYQHGPLVEVICQLRFPAIPALNAESLPDYPSIIRKSFPRYILRPEGPAGGTGTGPSPALSNHSFISTDGVFKVNLTQDFFAFSTLRYHRWEDFAFRMDKPLATFIQLYQPSHFNRIGLRYVNAVSRNALGLQDMLWDDLIQPHYLGVLGEPDVDEIMITRASVDTELSLPDGSRAKLRAGPGLLSRAKQDPEVKFILDADLSKSGLLTADLVPTTLDTLHTNADDLFRGAITPTLHKAMAPAPLEWPKE